MFSFTIEFHRQVFRFGQSSWCGGSHVIYYNLVDTSVCISFQCLIGAEMAGKGHKFWVWGAALAYRENNAHIKDGFEI